MGEFKNNIFEPLAGVSVHCNYQLKKELIIVLNYNFFLFKKQ